MPWEQGRDRRGAVRRSTCPGRACRSAARPRTRCRARTMPAAADAKRKLSEIAAHELGGIAGRLRHRRRARVLGRAARRAGSPMRRPPRAPIALGGRFDGHELPDDINALTASVGDRAGRARADGRGQGHLSARRRHVLVRRSGWRRSKSTSRRADAAGRLSRRRRRRDCRQSPQHHGPAARRQHPRHGARALSRSGSTTSTTASRWPSASIRTSR